MMVNLKLLSDNENHKTFVHNVDSIMFFMSRARSCI